MLHTPGLVMLRYVGENPRLLREVRVRKYPTLKKGDTLLIAETTAIYMIKKYGFELVSDQSVKATPIPKEKLEESKGSQRVVRGNGLPRSTRNDGEKDGLPRSTRNDGEV